MYNRDLAGSRFSPLTQVNTKNVGKLTEAWTFKLPRHPSSGGITGGYELTPIVVNGVMYITSVDTVVALEPEIGQGTLALQGGGRAGFETRRGLLAGRCE